MFNRSDTRLATKEDLKKLEERLTVKVSELLPKLTALDTHLDKVKAEILAEIKRLNDALSDTEIPADAATALDNLEAKAQSIDDIVPDSSTPPTV